MLEDNSLYCLPQAIRVLGCSRRMSVVCRRPTGAATPQPSTPTPSTAIQR